MRFIFLIYLLSQSLFCFSQTENNTCFNQVSGKVINKQTQAVIPNAFIQLKLNGVIIEELHSDENGMFTFQLNCDARYQISSVYENFTKSIKLVFTAKNPENHTVLLEMIPLNEFKIINNQKLIVLEPIYFEPDDFSITKEASNQLDMVSDIMNKYAQLKIEIAFHSNNMGDLNFLKSLSQKRADTCAEYLYKKGVNSSRITAKGYGFSNPITDCDKESMKGNKEKCLKNYRTEFIVTSEIIE